MAQYRSSKRLTKSTLRSAGRSGRRHITTPHAQMGGSLPPVTPLTSICDLPIQIILHLSELSDTNMLYKLTTLSPYLSEIIVPIYLRRVGAILFGQSESGEATRRDDFAIGSVEVAKALCTWKRHSTFYNISDFVIDFTNVHAHEQSIFVDSVALFFMASPTVTADNLGSTESVRIDHFLSNSNPVEIHRLIRGLTTANFKNLYVEGSTSGHFIGQVEAMDKFRDPFKDVDPLYSPFRALESFHSHSPALFLRPFRSWTVSALRCSNLISLTLCHSGLSYSQWKSILPSLEFSNLESLAIDGDIALISIKKFISRHQSLISLTIDEVDAARYDPRRPLGKDGEKLSLPYLRNITAPAWYLSQILPLLAYPLSIKDVTITPFYVSVTRQYLSGVDIMNALESLFRCKRVTDLKIKFPSDITPSADHLFDEVSPRSQVGRQLRSIKTITFTMTGFGSYFDEAFVCNSVKWLKLFPSLKSLNLFHISQSSKLNLRTFIKTNSPGIKYLFMTV